MSQLPDDTRIKTKYRCPDCYQGKIPHGDSSKIFDHTYCPTCDGTGYIEYWASLVEISQAVNRVNTILSSGK